MPFSWDDLEEHRKAYVKKKLLGGTESSVDAPRSIELTRGYKTLVDDEDYDYLNQWNWFYLKAFRSSDKFYAKANFVLNSKPKQLFLHRLIMNAPRHLDIDHINRNGLDNRKCNLRLCTTSQNCANKTAFNKWSEYKGIMKHRKAWVAAITVNNNRIYLGSFKTEIEAARAYNEKAKEFYGEFALLNNI